MPQTVQLDEKTSGGSPIFGAFVFVGQKTVTHGMALPDHTLLAERDPLDVRLFALDERATGSPNFAAFYVAAMSRHRCAPQNIAYMDNVGNVEGDQKQPPRSFST